MANPPNKTQPPPLKPAANAYHLLNNESQTIIQPPNPPPVRGRPAPQPPVPVPPPIAHFTISGATFRNIFGGFSVPLEIQGTGTIFSSPGNGAYSFMVTQGFSGSVVPHWFGGTFAPPFIVYSNVQADTPNQNYVFYGTALHISGTASQNGTGMQFVAVEIQGDGTVITAANGSYGFDVFPGFTGTTIPHWFGGTFNPGFRAYVDISTDQPNQNFTFFGTVPQNAIHIAGTVTQSGTGIPASIEVFGNGTFSTSATGSYDFTVMAPFSGTTIPHVGVGTNGSFVPVDYVYTSINTNQTNQNFAFVANLDCPIPTTLTALNLSGTLTNPTYQALVTTTNELALVDDSSSKLTFVNALTNQIGTTINTGNTGNQGAPCIVYDSFNDQLVLMDYNGDIFFVNPHTRLVTARLSSVIRFPSFHLLAADPATGHIFATNYRTTGFPNGRLFVIDGGAKTILSWGTNTKAPDAITWVPTLNRVYIGGVGIGAPLFTLFDPVGTNYTNSVVTADTNFNYEVFFHAPTGFVLHSRDGSHPSRVVNPNGGGSVVTSIDPTRLTGVTVNTCTGETWVSDGNNLVYELDNTGTLATVAAYSTKPNDITFVRRTNLVYFSDYFNKQFITMPTVSQSDPFFGLDQYGFTTFGSLPGITAITFNNVVSIPGFDIESDPVLTSLDWPFLVYVDPNNFQSGYITVLSNSSLTHIGLPVWSPTPGINYEFGTNALDVTSVNNILHRAVANSSYTSGILNLAGGANAAPTGQGITDRTTLNGRGVTVYTN